MVLYYLRSQFARDHTSRRNPSSLIPSGLFFYNPFSDSRELDFVNLDVNPNQSSRVRVPSLSFLDSIDEINVINTQTPRQTKLKQNSNSSTDSASHGGIVRILHSCNGLMLCRFYTELSVAEVGVYICVCNPTTKTYKMLPKPNIAENESIFSFTLVFDPWESDQYRVVFVKNSSSSRGDYSIDIYTSENGLWRTSVRRFRLPVAWLFNGGSGVYWDGVIHWISDNNLKRYSLQFIIRNMRLMITEFTRKPLQSSTQYFGEFRGHLHLIYVGDLLPEQLEVLEKDKGTWNWSMRYRVDMNSIVSAFPEIVREAGMNVDRLISQHPQIAHVIRNCSGAIRDKEHVFSILRVVEGGEKEEDLELVLIIPGKVISYNFKHKTSKLLCEFPCKELPSKDLCTPCYNCDDVFPFIESLASV